MEPQGVAPWSVTVPSCGLAVASKLLRPRGVSGCSRRYFFNTSADAGRAVSLAVDITRAGVLLQRSPAVAGLRRCNRYAQGPCTTFYPPAPTCAGTAMMVHTSPPAASQRCALRGSFMLRHVADLLQVARQTCYR